LGVALLGERIDTKMGVVVFVCCERCGAVLCVSFPECRGGRRRPGTYSFNGLVDLSFFLGYVSGRLTWRTSPFSPLRTFPHRSMKRGTFLEPFVRHHLFLDPPKLQVTFEPADPPIGPSPKEVQT